MNDDPVTLPVDDPLARRVDEFRENPQGGAFVSLRAELRANGRGELLAELCSFWAARDPNPKSAAEAWSEAGEVLYVMGLVDPAIERLRLALELDPLSERAVDRLVEALLDRGDVAAAVEPIEHELAELGKRGEARPRKGDPVVLRRAEQHRRAAKLWNDSLGRVDRALWHWQQAWRLEPHRLFELLHRLGEVLAAQRGLAQIVVQPGPPLRRPRRAQHLQLGAKQLGDHGLVAQRGVQVARLLQRVGAVRLEPRSTQVREALAEAYALSGRGPDAARRASEIFVELGRSQLERDDATGIQTLRRAVGVDPSSSSGSKALEQALYTARRWRDLDRLLQERLLLVDKPEERMAILARRAELLRGPLPEPEELVRVLGELVALEGPRGASSAELR
ncbi:MAG TPA: hypothetical protein PKU97_07510, partial [Kofleriaceae bacterium]|nr:hypothetical protein [Kofleriaceae bacterium]